MIVGIGRQSWHPVQVLCVIKALQKHNFQLAPAFKPAEKSVLCSWPCSRYGSCLFNPSPHSEKEILIRFIS